MPKNEKPRIIDQKRGSGSGYTFVSGNGGGGGGGGVTDHGLLTGLLDDDHPQYHTDARGDLRYVPTTRQVVGSGGLSGGGALTGDLALVLAAGVAGDGLAWQTGNSVLKVGAGDGLTVAADTVGVNGTVARSTWPVTAGNGLTGGGNLAAAGITLDVAVANTGATGLSVEANAIRLTSNSNPGAAAAVLATDSSGVVQLASVKIGATPAFTLFGTNLVGTGPDIDFDTNALIVAQGSMYLGIDSDHSGTDASFIWGMNARTSAFDELMRLTETGRLGIGNNAPAYNIDVTGTGRITTSMTTPTVYATTKLQTTLIDTASGNISLTPVGDIVLDPGGSDVLPGGSVEDDLGDYNRKWRTLFASELYVETLVAQDVLSTIGGRIEVTPTTTLIADLDNADTTMDVKHNNLRNGEYAYLMTAPAGVARFEAIKVTSGATTITGGYRYSVTRNLDGTGANQFYVGDAVASLGKDVGEGHISLTATSTVYNHLGPTIVTYSRNSTSTWSALTPTTAQGNLESFVGYGVPTQGFAVGNDLTKEPNTGFKGLTADATNGVRLFNTALSMYDGATEKFHLGAWNDLWFGPSSSDKRLSWNGSTLAISGQVTATSGAIANWNIGTVNANTISNTDNYIRLIAGGVGTARLEVGDGTTAGTGAGIVSRSATTNPVIWAGALYASAPTAPFRVYSDGKVFITAGGSGVKDSTLNGWAFDSTEIVGQASGVDQVVLTTAGRITAGAGKAMLDADGVKLAGGTSLWQQGTALEWYGTPATKTTLYGRLGVFRYNADLDVTRLYMQVKQVGVDPADIYFETLNASGITVSSMWLTNGGLSVNGQGVWTAGNDGAGSLLDADKLDGSHAADFATAGHNHSGTYSLTSHDHSGTYSALGHTHSYAPLSGATFTGNVSMEGGVTIPANISSTEYNRWLDIGIWRTGVSAPARPTGAARIYVRQNAGDTSKVQLVIQWPAGNETIIGSQP